MTRHLSMREHRCAALYALLRDPASRILTREDVHLRLRQRWAHDTIETAIADLVARNLIAEDAYGGLIVGPDADRSAA